MREFEKITLIANPVAQNGAGADAAQRAYRLLCELYGSGRVMLASTQFPGHGADLACEAAGTGSEVVIALGGDGLLHEAVNGLMSVGKAQRPILGLIPLGSGNDYARSIGMPEGVNAAIEALKEAKPRSVDVGVVNGHYFAETLSFGLDAAIALGTVEQRKLSGHTGTRLYMEVGFDQLAHHLDVYSYEARVTDGVKVAYQGQHACEVGPLAPHPFEIAGQSLIFAVQVGPTYGGGFRICPDARLDDGKLDICIAHPPVSIPRAVGIFLRAKDGKHTSYKPMEFFRCKGMTIRFNAPIPTQMDGERLEADEYCIGIVPNALQVLQRV